MVPSVAAVLQDVMPGAMGRWWYSMIDEYSFPLNDDYQIDASPAKFNYTQMW